MGFHLLTGSQVATLVSEIADFFLNGKKYFLDQLKQATNV